MAYTKWREQTFSGLGRMGFTYYDASLLLRAATSLQRSSEAQCSFDMGERETKRLERRDAAAEERVRQIVCRYGASVEFQGDPRGCPFTVSKDGRDESVPGHGLPARCFS